MDTQEVKGEGVQMDTQEVKRRRCPNGHPIYLYFRYDF